MHDTKLLQVRGVNASGKTTCMKSFIAHHGLQLAWTANLPFYLGGRFCVLGDYSKDGCCGPDRLKGCDDLICRSLLFLRNEFQPEWLMFEHAILSTVYSFSDRLRKLFQGRYGAILFDPRIDDVFNHLAQRNGGKQVSQKNVFSKYVMCKRSWLKMKYNGFYVEKVNPFSYSKENMHQIIDGFIERYDKWV